MKTVPVEPGTLFIVATPIGNLQDITLRALDVLKSVDLIAAEDTRHSQRLLAHYGIKKPMQALHQHNELTQRTTLVDRLAMGHHVALISDAGTPLISDPGYHLVSAVRTAGFRVEAVPGACAAIAAVSVAGLPTDRFQFIGFLPAKSAARKAVLRSLSDIYHTLIFYESSHRIQTMLADMTDCFAENCQVVVARELTKCFETVLKGTLDQVLCAISADANQRKGEFVVMTYTPICQQSESLQLNAEQKALLEELLKLLPVSKVATLYAKVTGIDRKTLYRDASILKAKR